MMTITVQKMLRANERQRDPPGITPGAGDGGTSSDPGFKPAITAAYPGYAARAPPQPTKYFGVGEGRKDLGRQTSSVMENLWARLVL